MPACDMVCISCIGAGRDKLIQRGVEIGVAGGAIELQQCIQTQIVFLQRRPSRRQRRIFADQSAVFGGNDVQGVGRGVFDGEADVVVTDGIVGNVMLKLASVTS